MKKLKYIVTGTGRSGSVYLAKLLTSLGIPCGHECCFDWRGWDLAQKRLNGLESFEISHVSLTNSKNQSIPKWVDEDQIIADSSYMAAPFLNKLENVKIIHIVRNPIKVVHSFVNDFYYFKEKYPSNKYEEFIYEHRPELTQIMSQEERAIQYYISWNRMIEKQLEGRNYLFFRVEDSIDPILDFLEVEKPKKYFNDRRANTRQKPKKRFSLNEMPNNQLKEEFIEMGKRYGYSMGQIYL
jgi:hypothetical protein